MKFFLTMYFVLPECIPPRPLGEAGVRKQWSTEYTDLITIDTVWYITTDALIQTFYPPCPLPGAGLRLSCIISCYINNKA
jgi:hypothetical protein